jgi:hypothetical protein
MRKIKVNGIHRVVAPLLALLALSAIQFAGPAGTTPLAKASGCGHPIVDILYYQSHVAPNAGGVSPQPNSCWSWSDMRGVSQPNWRICSVNPGYPTIKFYGVGPGYAYDDTNSSHSSENSVILNCLGTNTQLYLEYEAASSCSTNWIGRVPSGISVYHYLREVYCSDSGRDVSSFVSAFTYSSTVGAVVNVGADVPTGDGGPCASSCQSNLTADVQAVCNRTPAGDQFGLYANYPVPAQVVGWVNAAINACA